MRDMNQFRSESNLASLNCNYDYHLTTAYLHTFILFNLLIESLTNLLIHCSNLLINLINRQQIMAGSDTEDFILIINNNETGKVQQQIMFDNAQLTHSIIQQSNSNMAGSTHSIDGWSEITAPSVTSIHSNQKKGMILCNYIYTDLSILTANKLIQSNVFQCTFSTIYCYQIHSR